MVELPRVFLPLDTGVEPEVEVSSKRAYAPDPVWLIGLTVAVKGPDDRHVRDALDIGEPAELAGIEAKLGD